MIKLNLLPQYIIEFRRIRTVILVFVITLAIEGGVVFKVYSDLQAQEVWFTKDKAYYDTRTTMINGEKSKADAIAGKAGKYASYIEYFTRKPAVDNANGIAKVLEEAAQKLGKTSASWFDEITIDKGTVSANGNINGLMNFVNFYFKMKKASFTVTPAAQPAPTPADAKVTMAQTVPLTISGTVSAMPTAPAPPEATPSIPADLYKPAGAAPAAVAPGAAAAPGTTAAPATTTPPTAKPAGK